MAGPLYRKKAKRARDHLIADAECHGMYFDSSLRHFMAADGNRGQVAAVPAGCISQEVA